MLHKYLIGAIVTLNVIAIQAQIHNPTCITFASKPGIEHTISIDNQSLAHTAWACVVADCDDSTYWSTQIPAGERFKGTSPQIPAQLRIYFDWKPSDKDLEIAAARKATGASRLEQKESSNAICPLNWPQQVKNIVIGPDQRGAINNRTVTINRDGTISVD